MEKEGFGEEFSICSADLFGGNSGGLFFLSIVFIKLLVNCWTKKIFSRTVYVVWVKIPCFAQLLVFHKFLS